MKNIEIRKPMMEDAVAFNTCIGGVAREGLYLLMVQAPDIEGTRRFLSKVIEKGLPQFFAFLDGELVGWCDVIPLSGDLVSHRAELGMGIEKEYRGKGIGTLLIKETISAAKDFGLEKIELTVYTSNINALKLYQKFGFKEEGRIPKYSRVNGKYNDGILMGLFL